MELPVTSLFVLNMFSGKLLDKEGPDGHKRVVLLDARNLYETRIGKFWTPNVETWDPEI